MEDFLRFVVRATWGGAIFTALIFTYYFGLRYGPIFFLDPMALPYFIVPGGMVGIVLWFWTGRVGYALGMGLRIIIGTGVVFVMVILLDAYHLATTRFLQDGLAEISSWQKSAWIFQLTTTRLIESVGVGGLAGLACPSNRVLRRAPRTSYRERAQSYEAAETQARLSRLETVAVKINDRGQK
jgi:hypothetical protein